MKSMVIWALVLLILGILPAQVLAGFQPTPSGGTGPYQEVYSASAYSYTSSNVFLPGSGQINIASSHDTAYVYTGGWGLNGAGAVDAGFQYSPTYNDWSLFTSYNGTIQGYGNDSTRFSASQTLSLTLALVQSGSNLDLIVTAVGVEVNTSTVVTESLTIVNPTGWAMGVNTLKRVTSMAQSSGYQNFADGSYINGVVWSNATLGQSASTATAWTGGGSITYPSTPNVVTVNYVDPADETDNINLVPNAVPEPQSWALLAVGQVLGLGYCWRKRARRAAVAPAT